MEEGGERGRRWKMKKQEGERGGRSRRGEDKKGGEDKKVGGERTK